MRSSLLAALAFVAVMGTAAAATAATPLDTLLQPHRPIAHHQWTLQPAESLRPDQLATLSFVLEKRNLPELQSTLLRVSDPTHAEYGKHLSRHQLREMVQPDPAVVAQWNTWAESLIASGSGRVEWNEPRDILHVHLPVSRMEQLIGHELRSYTHRKLGVECIRASVSSSQLLGREAGVSSALVDAIPEGLHETVAYLAGVSRFPPQVEARSNRPRRLDRSTLETYRAPAVPVRAGPLSALGSKAAAASLTTTAPDTHGLTQILANTWVVTDSGELTMLVFPACTTPITGGGNWTFPVRTNSGFKCPYKISPSTLLGYASTTIVISSADEPSTSPITLVIPAAASPLGVWAATGQAAMVLTIPLPDDFVGWNLQVTYSWAGQTTSFPYGTPFAVKGTPRIVPLLVSQLYGVPDALVDGVSGAVRARSRMSIAGLALNHPDSQAYFDSADIAAFLSDNRIDPWMAQSILSFVPAQGEGNNPDNPDAETTLDISEAMGANGYVGLSVLHVPLSSSTPFEDLMNLALADPTINVLSISYGTDEENVRDATGPSNALFMQLGSSGVSVFVSSGDSGAYLQPTGCSAFAPAWPASSPWVTSVGGSTLSKPLAVSCGAILNGHRFEFSSLAGSDLQGSDGANTYTYYLRVCGALSSTPTAPCTQIMSSASACQIQVSGGTGTFDVGNWIESSPPVWSFINPAQPGLGVQYSMLGAQSCWNSPPVQSYQAVVQFMCAATASAGFTVSTPPGSCTQTYTIHTPLACGASSQVNGASGVTGSASSSSQCMSEVVSSIEYGSSITAGGGFSALSREQPQPAYQKAAVSSWLNSSSCPKPATMAYNVANRAYPDITLLAHNFEISFEGKHTEVDGTSASAPVLAGIIARYNLARSRTGLPPLGFLNPLLYQTAASTPAAFNDLTEGSNRCMALGEGCCAEGFEACPGFDPVGGLGSPNMRVLGPILYPDSAANLTVSNYFFPDCPAHTSWPSSPPWPDHEGPASDNHVGVAVAVALVMVGVVALAIWAGMRVYHRRKYRQAQEQPGAGAGYVVAMQPMRHEGEPPHLHWGAGRPLGHAIVPVQPEGPLSPNDLSAPLAGPGPHSDE